MIQAKQRDSVRICRNTEVMTAVTGMILLFMVLKAPVIMFLKLMIQSITRTLLCQAVVILLIT